MLNELNNIQRTNILLRLFKPVLSHKKHKYEVHTETKGVLKFVDMPKSAYCASGYQDRNDENKMYWFGFDNGTCLISFNDVNGNNVYKTPQGTYVSSTEYFNNNSNTPK